MPEADLPDPAAFYRAVNRKGTLSRIFMNGEESGPEGRAFAHFVSGADAGTSYELPALGKASWENILASPYSKNKTVTVGLDDGLGGQVYVYVGKKSRKGDEVTRAGLTDGKLYGIKVDGLSAESNTTTIAPETRFTLVEIPGAASMTGAQLEAASNALGITNFARPEDGSWSPIAGTDFYFNTTGTFTGVSRTWRLEFDDPVDVETGGVVGIAVQGGLNTQVGPRMMDNLTTTDSGGLVLQEDPGNQAYLAGVWLARPSGYSPVAPQRVLTFDPALFTAGQPGFLTQDEESSGIIPLPFLGPDTYLLTAQVHAPSGDPETVEKGQLLVAHLPHS